MRKKIIIFLLLTITSVFVIEKTAYAQADEIISNCTKYMTLPFISDGQQYKALLNGDEIAEFYATFYGGSTYRIVGCSGMNPGNLIFSVYDENRNLLFTNEDYNNTPFWDFKFTSTVDCIIEAKLDTKNLASGFAILLIGFKQ